MRLLRAFIATADEIVLSRPTHLLATYVVQLGLFLIAGIAAFLLRFDFSVPPDVRLTMLWALIAWVLIKPATLLACRATSAWRYFSTPDLLPLAGGNFAGFAIAGAALFIFCPVRVPRSVLLVDLALSILLTTGARVLTRVSYEMVAQTNRTNRRRTLVYGAGAAGVLLLREARGNRSFPFLICGFIDDAKPKGMSIQGVPILGRGPDLAEVICRHNIAKVLIAIPSGTSAQMSRIAGHCHGADVSFRTVPSLSELIAHQSLSKQIREVAIEDMLGRSPVQLDNPEIGANIRGKIALVTGAAGSIGSELCRQIARFGPVMLVGLDLSETALFYLDREMADAFPEVKFCPEIGNIQNLQRLREVFAEYWPTVVFHAAAFKHVPMMERHIFQAVENNVFGTHNLATVAAEFGVEDFVMISSDKAVNPTNIMGATKRVAEMLVRSFQKSPSRFVSVRFGNVLGSNGSVVPIFKKQIAAGGPVTITHPEMQRYFMTISEAAQLVLQAWAMGRGGEIFVLDMGQPVKIVNLARELIRLSGLQPDDDIKIEFTGVRPGEKLCEEVNMAGEDMLPTHHQKVKVFAGASFPPAVMSIHLEQLRDACERRDARSLLYVLKSIVPDYVASQNVLERSLAPDLLSLGEALEIHRASKPLALTLQS